MKFSSLEVLRVPGRERRAERDTGVQTPREKQTLQASEEEGGVGGNSRSKLRNPASLGWAAGREGTGRRGSWGKVAPWEAHSRKEEREPDLRPSPIQHPGSSPTLTGGGGGRHRAWTKVNQLCSGLQVWARTQGGPSHCTFLGLGDPSFALEESLDLHLPRPP